MKTLTLASTLGLLLVATSVASSADEPSHHLHQHPAPTAASPAKHTMASDPRTLVKYPDPLRIHTLTNMRDHLLAVAEIQDQLARSLFDKASDIAEQRLGMSSLGLHGAHEVAPYMPKGCKTPVPPCTGRRASSPSWRRTLR